MFIFIQFCILLSVLTLGATQNDKQPLKVCDIQEECILRQHCPRALELIISKDKKTFRSLICEFEKSEIKICCEKNRTDVELTFKNTTEETTTDRSIAQSENNKQSMKTCIISDNIQGECILMQNCPRATELIKIKDIKTLRSLTCGYDKLDVKVCCLTNRTDEELTFKNTTRETTTDRSIDQSENDKQSPKKCNLSNNIQGECILMRHCPRATELLAINDIKTLRSLTCGYDKLDAKICCVTSRTDEALTFDNATRETTTDRSIDQSEIR